MISRVARNLMNIKSPVLSELLGGSRVVKRNLNTSSRRREREEDEDNCCCDENDGPGIDGPPKGSPNTYRAITLFVALPFVLTYSVIQYINEKAKEVECSERPEFIPYEYLRIRTKRFPWGDGNKTLFHNPHKNALPDGYED